MASTISPQKFRESRCTADPMRLLDVRSAAEFAIGHIPGAVNIPMEQVEARMADVPSSPLILTCESGKRAEIVAHWLADQRELSLLEGGTRAWREAGYPLVGCAPCRWALERQVRLIAGLLVFASVLLSIFVNVNYVYAALLVGAGLTFAGVTNICGMALLLAKMPWNAARKSEATTAPVPGANCIS